MQHFSHPVLGISCGVKSNIQVVVLYILLIIHEIKISIIGSALYYEYSYAIELPLHMEFIVSVYSGILDLNMDLSIMVPASMH